MEFYHESVGECVNQVYKIDANTWEEAKKVAFDDMAVGDYIAMCNSDAVKEYDNWTDYHYIEVDMCKAYAQLKNGCWSTRLDTNDEYWEDRVFTFSDDPDTYLDRSGNEFNNWKCA